MIDFTLEDKLYLKKLLVNTTSSIEDKIKREVDGKSHWGRHELKELVHWSIVHCLIDQGISIDCMPEFIKVNEKIKTKFTKERCEDILELKDKMDKKSEEFIKAMKEWL